MCGWWKVDKGLMTKDNLLMKYPKRVLSPASWRWLIEEQVSSSEKVLHSLPLVIVNSSPWAQHAWRNESSLLHVDTQKPRVTSSCKWERKDRVSTEWLLCSQLPLSVLVKGPWFCWQTYQSPFSFLGPNALQEATLGRNGLLWFTVWGDSPSWWGQHGSRYVRPACISIGSLDLIMLAMKTKYHKG